MRALVTGCAGFVGSHLTESLLADGALVLGVDCFNENYGRAEKLRNLEVARQWDSFEFVPIDLTRGDLDALVGECDVTFHLAAEPGVRPSWGNRFERYLSNNVLATQHLLESARRWPDRRFVYASSSSIYGQAERMPTQESDTPAPYSPYGVTKLAGEHLCELYRDNFGVDSISLRYFSVYGPRQRPDMAFSRFCDAIVDGRSLEVFGSGDQTRDFTFVSDIVAATRAAAEAEAPAQRVLNVGGGSRASLNEALGLLAEISGRQFEVDRSHEQRGDVRDTGADIAAASAALGYTPQVEFGRGLATQWEWALRQREPPLESVGLSA